MYICTWHGGGVVTRTGCGEVARNLQHTQTASTVPAFAVAAKMPHPPKGSQKALAAQGPRGHVAHRAQATMQAAIAPSLALHNLNPNAPPLDALEPRFCDPVGGWGPGARRAGNLRGTPAAGLALQRPAPAPECRSWCYKYCRRFLSGVTGAGAAGAGFRWTCDRQRCALQGAPRTTV